MKFLNLLLGMSLLPLASWAAPKTKTQPQPRPLNVAFLVYDQVEPLDLSGPLDVFVKAENFAPGSYNSYTVAVKAGVVKTQDGALTIQPRYTFANCPRPDVIVIPGASVERISVVAKDPNIVGWIKRNSTPNQTAISVCTGAFLLAKAGVLNGKPSTTHFYAQLDLQRQYPKTQVQQGLRFVEAGNVITASGVTSGIDGALHFVKKRSGASVADGVARLLQYRLDAAVYPDQKRGRVIVPPMKTKTVGVAESSLPLAAKICPVCHMKISPKSTTAATYAGKRYGFCTSHCRDTFIANPSAFPVATTN